MKIDTVCIIDDDPICVYGTKILLNHNNFVSANILVYEDGYEALNSLTTLLKNGQKMPDIILLDLNMPVMNGWEFLDKFQKLTFSNIPKVYIVSSHFDAIEIEKGRSYEMVRDFISKPLIAKNLTDIISMGKIAS
ncbi:two-component system response regulator [Maribacter sp. Asnod2-G09]|uniref:response regulator n=1 Tax=Maribacter sp. Asnod2-G09 TaxID=3160577 RepID=UPI00386D2518